MATEQTEVLGDSYPHDSLQVMRNCPCTWEDLPVELPLDVVFTEDQSGNPLESHHSFVQTICPKCGSEARRETDTMDTFYDSSWYFMRFCDANNDESPFNRSAVDYWMDGGVDLYIGG